jgi:ribonuclease HII
LNVRRIEPGDIDTLMKIFRQTENRVAGVDEAGRGPLAGPVVAAAVILDPDRQIDGLDDSKRLTPIRRETLAEEIKQAALCWSTASATVQEIDQINILQATLMAMARAAHGLLIAPAALVVDGNQAPPVAQDVYTAIKGDGWIPAVSAASILAKVERDKIMLELDKQYPEYGFAKHKGYPTKEHLSALSQSGVTEVHRKSYRPVKQFLLSV